MALSLEPDMDIALLMRADAYRRSGDMERFEETASKIPASSYLRPFAELQLAQNSIKSKGAEAKSIVRLEGIIKAEPDILQAYSILGDYYKGKKEYEKALKVYTAGIEHGGADSIMGDLYFSRAGARDAMGDREAAGLDLDKAVELLPRNPVVLNYYGYFLISGQGDEDKAFGLIERAMAADPANPYYLDSYGWAFFKKGDRTRALKMLEYARALSPKNPVIIDHLASVYWSLGRYDEARFEWGKALEFFGSGDWNDSLTRRDIERRLEHGFEG
jgi:tetratricopeptide (TPR) repeat protein